MSPRVLLCAFLFTASAAARADTYAYVSLAGENRVAIYRVDPATGALVAAGELATGGAPGALAVDPSRRFLFASLRSVNSLGSYRVDLASGKLTPLSTVPAGADAAFVGVDGSGRYLLSAYYTAGKVMVHAIGKDGTLEREPRAEIPTDRNAHCMMPDPEGRFVFAPHTGPNAIFRFTLDRETGRLAPASEPRVTTPDRTGPRHLRFHPSRRFAYVANEQGSSVTGYAYQAKTGSLTPFQTLSTLPAGFQGGNTCAEIRIHPAGRFLYVSNRGHDSIACFTLDPATGRMTATGHASTEKTPRAFDLDPSGNFLYAAGQASGRLASYRIDPQNGTLKPLTTYEVGKQPAWVMVVSLPE